MEERLGSRYSDISRFSETESRKKPVVLFMGPEGSGKSTQAERFAQKHNLPKVTMGDEFKNLAENDTSWLGIACKKMLETGEYSDDELFWRVFNNRFKEGDVANGVVIDGAFRTHGQIVGFKENIRQYVDEPDITVFYLRSSVWEGAARAIERGSRYDTPERILSRENNFYKDLGKRSSLIRENFRFIQVRTTSKSIDDLEGEINEVYEAVRRDEE